MHHAFFRCALLALGGLLAPALRAAPVDVLIAAASDAELQPILSQLADIRTETRAAWQNWTGTLGGKTIALTRTDGDPLNAVAATTLALRRHPPRLVITCGPARAHDPSLHAGDVVLSEQFAAFDGMISPHTELGTGSAPLTWSKLPHAILAVGEKENYLEKFPADAATLAAARKLTGARGRLVAGVLGSAHQVNREADRVAWLRAQWGTASEDLESAHVAGCALLFDKPVFGLRVIDGQPGEAATLVLTLLKTLP